MSADGDDDYDVDDETDDDTDNDVTAQRPIQMWQKRFKTRILVLMIKIYAQHIFIQSRRFAKKQMIFAIDKYDFDDGDLMTIILILFLIFMIIIILLQARLQWDPSNCGEQDASMKASLFFCDFW